ncbi:MAG: hypothetical protein D6722_28075 [Bacteroidetes bacterium]|nr:MAG: hypothetical protein D6722_28075 [Bacteroidota bacterium]
MCSFLLSYALSPFAPNSPHERRPHPRPWPYLPAQRLCRSEGPCPSPATYTPEGGHYGRISGSYEISGVYPHLTTYTHSRTDQRQSYVPHYEEADRLAGQWECGIGALAEWQGKLYMVN